MRLERQVEAREEEIARLGRQVGNDGNLEKVHVSKSCVKTQRPARVGGLFSESM